jgi:hypothetical protein
MPKNEVNGDEVARLQLSQWQWACHRGAASARKVTSPQKQRPVMGGFMRASVLARVTCNLGKVKHPIALRIVKMLGIKAWISPYTGPGS